MLGYFVAYQEKRLGIRFSDVSFQLMLDNICEDSKGIRGSTLCVPATNKPDTAYLVIAYYLAWQPYNRTHYQRRPDSPSSNLDAYLQHKYR
jgi:hypothetical protein